MSWIHGFRDANALVYHYTSARTAHDHILRNRTLRLGSFASTNDPKESKAWRFNLATNRNRDLGKYNFEETSERFSAMLKQNAKVACFCTDDDSLSGNHLSDLLKRGYCKPRMWAQYADKHQGVCLAFKRDELLRQAKIQGHGVPVLAGRVEYRDREVVRDLTLHEYVIDVDALEALGFARYALVHLERHHRALFFEKLQDWRDEREWRIVALGTAPGPFDVNYGDALAGIMHGADIEEEISRSIVDMTTGTPVEHMGLTWKNSCPWYNFEAMRWTPVAARVNRRPVAGGLERP